MIAVTDVEASSRFYCEVLGAQSGHGGKEYEQIARDGALLLQLHHRDAHEHPHLFDPSLATGNGVLLWFQTGEFDATLERVRASGATILEGPAVNENANHRECMFVDPDGYKVVIASPFGDLG
jgi:catechol 2,3-dioxygenase-like lactoylglutathione lyase family enzyme